VTTTNHDDDRARVARIDKEFSTLRARAALAGFQLHIVTGPDGTAEYLMIRWNMTRALPNLAAVAAFLDGVER